MPSLSQMPVELISHIISFLPQNDLILSVPYVCKLFRKAAVHGSDVYKNINLTILPEHHKVAVHLGPWCRSCVEISVYDHMLAQYRFKQMLAATLPDLKRINVLSKKTNAIVLKGGLFDFNGGCQALEVVNVSACCLDERWHTNLHLLPNLKKVQMRWTYIGGASSNVWKTLRKCTKLEVVHAGDAFVEVSNHDVKTLLQRQSPSKLVELDFCGHTFVSEDPFVDPLSLPSMRSLVEIDLADITHVTDRFFHVIAQSLGLKKINVGGTRFTRRHVTDNGVACLKNLKYLQKIDISGCISVTGRFLNSGFNALKILYIQEANLRISTITAVCPNLISLDVSCSRKPSSVNHYASHQPFPNLKVLRCSLPFLGQAAQFVKTFEKLEELEIDMVSGNCNINISELKALCSMRTLRRVQAGTCINLSWDQINILEAASMPRNTFLVFKSFMARSPKNPQVYSSQVRLGHT